MAVFLNDDYTNEIFRTRTKEEYSLGTFCWAEFSNVVKVQHCSGQIEYFEDMNGVIVPIPEVEYYKKLQTDQEIAKITAQNKLSRVESFLNHRKATKSVEFELSELTATQLSKLRGWGILFDNNPNATEEALKKLLYHWGKEYFQTSKFERRCNGWIQHEEITLNNFRLWSDKYRASDQCVYIRGYLGGNTYFSFEVNATNYKSKDWYYPNIKNSIAIIDGLMMWKVANPNIIRRQLVFVQKL
jgi:hypothetical protein